MWNGRPWPFFLMAWPDGSTEPPEEDYGPDWPLLRELESGIFVAVAHPSERRQRSFLGLRLGSIVTRWPDEVPYAVTWLGAKDSEVAWAKLGLKCGG